MIKQVKHLLFLLLWMVVLARGAQASTELWAKLMVDAQRNHRSASGFLNAMRVAEQYGEHDARLHIAMTNAGDAVKSENPALAESLFKRDISELETIDRDFPEIPCDCFQLASLYLRQRRFSEAEAQLRRAIAVRNKWRDVSSNNPFNAQLFASLYLAYYSQGDTEAAKSAYDQMLNAIQQLRLERRRTECLGVIRSLIYNYACNQQGLSQLQVRHLNEIAWAFATEEEAGRKKIGNLHLIADQLYWSAEIALALGDLKKAESMARQSLDLVRNKLDTAKEFSTLKNDTAVLSQILCKQARYREAKELQEQLLSVLVRDYGPASKV